VLSSNNISGGYGVTMTAAGAAKMRIRLSTLCDDLADFLKDAGQQAKPGSIAEQEIKISQAAKHLQASLDHGWLLIESAADHLMAVLRILEEPCMTIAPWGCARGVLEAAAFGCWLQDDRIDAHERLSRGLALRYDAQEEQHKFARAAGRPATEVKLVEERILYFEKEALTFGVATHRKNGKVTRVGTPIPSATTCVQDTLGHGMYYKLFSAMVHGKTWAHTQLGFIKRANGSSRQYEKGLNAHAAALLLLTAASALSRVIWTRAILCGYDRSLLEGRLEECFDDLGADQRFRFWR
jgi:hypothetical protein